LVLHEEIVGVVGREDGRDGVEDGAAQMCRSETELRTVVSIPQFNNLDGRYWPLLNTRSLLILEE
jgi:hypothetical protein